MASRWCWMMWLLLVGGGVDSLVEREVGAAERPTVELIAHRGASHDAPENTLRALRLGFEQQSDAGELDVWVSRDGVPVVIHDADTKRVAGVPRKVSEQTLAELQALDVGSWKGAHFAGERIPTLREALAIVPAGRRLFVEIKCGVEGVPAILRVLQESAMPAPQLVIISFSSAVVAAAKQARPDLHAYWIVAWKKDKEGREPRIEQLIEQARRSSADGLDLSDHPQIDAEVVSQVRAANLRLYVWTVDDAAAARRLARLGVDGITTNRPGWLREQLAAEELSGNR
ncbi:MAG: glycerophosphodiester phosphodiesterase [Pirellulales bacterium]